MVQQSALARERARRVGEAAEATVAAACPCVAARTARRRGPAPARPCGGGQGGGLAPVGGGARTGRGSWGREPANGSRSHAAAARHASTSRRAARARVQSLSRLVE